MIGDTPNAFSESNLEGFAILLNFFPRQQELATESH